MVLMSFMPLTTPLISVDHLRTMIDANVPLRLLDVRYRLGHTDGHDLYRAGHIPGAVYVDLDTELAGHGEPQEGRHPLPAHDELQAAARRWGISAGDTVIVYDDARMLPASRAWWALHRTGVDVRVLDGGLAAWRDAGGEIETGEVLPEPGDVTLIEPSGDDVISTAEAAQWPAHGVLLDARASERYRGETEPIDPIAGHIPGARNLSIADLLTSDGHFRDADEIAEVFEERGVAERTRVAAYCGSGVTAAQLALAGAIIGRDVSVYVGSWSAWSNTPDAKIATGEDS